MLCTGPNWEPSRGAAGESGKSVVLRNWWSYGGVIALYQEKLHLGLKIPYMMRFP
jgi:hypothetical protein